MPGTHVAIVPPSGYVPSTTFNGFENKADSLPLVVSELPAGPFDATDANLARGGYVVGSRERTNRGGQSLQLFDGEQTIDGKTFGRMVLSIGSADTSALVMADYPLDDRDRHDRIRIALRSVVARGPAEWSSRGSCNVGARRSPCRSGRQTASGSAWPDPCGAAASYSNTRDVAR